MTWTERMLLEVHWYIGQLGRSADLTRLETYLIARLKREKGNG